MCIRDRVEGTVSEEATYAARPRLCDLSYLREPYERADGSVGYRCPSEPVEVFVRKGGALEAVSYTHLDVYKRQWGSRASGASPTTPQRGNETGTGSSASSGCATTPSGPRTPALARTDPHLSLIHI